jgi:hypothetical protein
VQSAELKPAARQLGRLVRQLGLIVERTLIRHREEIIERQLVHERMAWVAMELFAAASALSRWDSELARGDRSHDAVARLMIADSFGRAQASLREMRANTDRLVREAASTL